MNLISISRSDNKRFSFFGKRFYDFNFPETWDEIKLSKRIAALKYSLLPYPDCFYLICRRIIHVPKLMIRGLSKEILWEVYNQLEWLRTQPTLTAIVPDFKYKLTRYYFPDPKFDNEAAIVYVIADEFYKEYVETNDPALLIKLLATLAREKNSEGRRVPIIDRKEVEQRALTLKKIDPVYPWMAFLYFTACKEFIHNFYGPYIFARPEENEGESGGDVVDFGWFGVFFKLAETNVFGKLDQVFQEDMHSICQYLMKNKIDSDREKSKKKTS